MPLWQCLSRKLVFIAASVWRDYRGELRVAFSDWDDLFHVFTSARAPESVNKKRQQTDHCGLLPFLFLMLRMILFAGEDHGFVTEILIGSATSSRFELDLQRMFSDMDFVIIVQNGPGDPFVVNEGTIGAV